MLAIITDIIKLIEHLVERQDVKILAWHSSITAKGLINMVIVHTTGEFYEVWEHEDGYGFRKTMDRQNHLPPEELFQKSIDNARYDENIYVLVCGIPQTSLERSELKIKITDYIINLFKVGIFAEIEYFWNTDVIYDTSQTSGGDVFMSGMPFYVKNKVGWVWSAGSPIKRAGIVTTISSEET